MNKVCLFLLFPLICVGQGYPPSDVQIKLALAAAPVDQRAGAMVYGFDASGKWIVLRPGTNDMVCLTDDPKQDGLNVSCYHKSLDPFMARGRELRAEGKSPAEILKIREEEVKAGKLIMPKGPTTLFVYYGPQAGFSNITGEITKAQFRYVVYIPYATAESTGLPLKPEAPGMPWLMDPGTHRAHIMITPPANDK